MKSLLQSFGLLAAVGLLMLGGYTPAPESTFGSTAVPQIEACELDLEDLAKRSLVCDCDPNKKCPCADCVCNTVPEKPLTVGLPPESLIVLASGGELFTQPPGLLPAKFTEPQQIKPVSTVTKKAATPAATGHWETRYAGFRGRRSYSVWVPDNPTGAACANSACSSGACANGSLPGYFYSSGGCRSCR